MRHRTISADSARANTLLERGKRIEQTNIAIEELKEEIDNASLAGYSGVTANFEKSHLPYANIKMIKQYFKNLGFGVVTYNHWYNRFYDWLHNSTYYGIPIDSAKKIKISWL